MKRVQDRGGYTILEVMIVLAVSAGLFFTAVVAFGGRQQEVQFNQAVRDFDSRLSDIMNDVSTGFFSNDDSYSCSVAGAAPYGLTITQLTAGDPGTNEQGGNSDCVFIGKVIQFQPQGEGVDKINLINVLGRRVDENNQQVNSLVDANPAGIVENLQTILLDWGLRVTRIAESGGGDLGAIGFFTGFTRTIGGTSDITLSNNQRVDFMAIPGSQLDEPFNDRSTGVFSSIDNINSNPTNAPITICLQKADQSKRAAIVIGLDGTPTTTVQFDDYDRSICGS